MRKIQAILCAMVLVFGTVGMSHAAPYIYTYTSNYFTDIMDDEPIPSGTYTTSDRLEFTVTTVDGMLPDKWYYEFNPPAVATWQWTDGYQSVSSSDPSTSLQFWEVHVVDGEIVYWNIIEPFDPIPRQRGAGRSEGPPQSGGWGST